MKYNAPFGVPDPTASYINGNPDAGVEGSIPPAEQMEYPQREIVAVIVAAGLSPTNTDLTQLLQAIRILAGVSGSALLHWGLDTGAVNAMVVTATPALTAYGAGAALLTVPTATNTNTTVTINVNGLGTKNIVKANGSALAVGDIQQSTLTLLVYDGTNFRLNYPAKSDITALIPTLILPGVNSTLYVRTDGTDDTAHDGSANNSAKAFATIAYAINYGLSRFSLLGGSLTIQLGNAGTYSAANIGSLPPTVGTLIIAGDTANQGSYIISGASTGSSNDGVIGLPGGTCIVRGVTLQNTGAGSNTVVLTSGATFQFDHVTFATTTTSTANCLNSFGGHIDILAGCIFSGNHAYLAASNNGSISFKSNVTISGGPTYSVATAGCFACGLITILPGVTFSGSATGARYFATTNGVINSNGGGTNAFPGSTGGTLLTGAQYV